MEDHKIFFVNIKIALWALCKSLPDGWQLIFPLSPKIYLNEYDISVTVNEIFLYGCQQTLTSSSLIFKKVVNDCRHARLSIGSEMEICPDTLHTPGIQLEIQREWFALLANEI